MVTLSPSSPVTSCMSQEEDIHPPCFGPPKLPHCDWTADWFHNRMQSFCQANEFPLPLYSATIAGLEEGGSMDHATELYQEMRKRDEIIDEGDFSGLIIGYFVAGRVSEAMQVFEFVPHKVHRTVVSYNSVLFGMCTTGRVEEAEAFYAQMVSSDVAPDTESCEILMRGLVGKGKLDEAVRVWEAYKSSSEDAIYGVGAYNVLLGAYLKAGSLSHCHEIVKEMIDMGCALNEDTYDLLFRGFCRRGWVEECLSLFRRWLDAGGIRGCFGQYGLLFPHLSDAGKLDEIRELFEGCVNNFHPFLPGSSECEMLVEHIWNEKRADEVRRIFQDVLEKKGVGREE